MSSMSFDPVTGKMRIDPDPRGGDRRPRWSDIDARIASGEQLPPQNQWFSGGNPFTLPQSGGMGLMPLPSRTPGQFTVDPREGATRFDPQSPFGKFNDQQFGQLQTGIGGLQNPNLQPSTGGGFLKKMADRFRQKRMAEQQQMAPSQPMGMFGMSADALKGMGGTPQPSTGGGFLKKMADRFRQNQLDTPAPSQAQSIIEYLGTDAGDSGVYDQQFDTNNDGVVDMLDAQQSMQMDTGLRNPDGTPATQTPLPPVNPVEAIPRFPDKMPPSIVRPPRGGGPFGGCPRPEEHIQLANNDWILAGELKVGDEVITSKEPQKVTFAKIIEDSPRREVLFTEGDSIVTSPSHPYFVKDKGFVDVEDLKEGDAVGDLIVSEVKPFSDGPVIHISVDKAQTYMLRGGTEENPVPALSHNKSPGRYTGPTRPTPPGMMQSLNSDPVAPPVQTGGGQTITLPGGRTVTIPSFNIPNTPVGTPPVGGTPPVATPPVVGTPPVTTPPAVTTPPVAGTPPVATTPATQPLAPYTGAGPTESPNYIPEVTRNETGMDALTQQLLFGLDGQGGFIPGAMQAAETTFFNPDGTPRVVEEQRAGFTGDQTAGMDLTRAGVGAQNRFLSGAEGAFGQGVSEIGQGVQRGRGYQEQGLGAIQSGIGGLRGELGGVEGIQRGAAGNFGTQLGGIAGRGIGATDRFGRRLGESENLMRGTTGAYDQAMTDQYYNPYEDRVVQQTIDDVLEAGDKQDMAARARNIQTGGESAFGSRARLGASERREALGRGLGEALGGIRSRGFTEAQRTGMGEFARQRQAERAASQGLAGLSGARLGAQQNLGSQLTGLAGQQLASQQNLGSALTGLAGTRFGAAQTGAGALSDMGALETQYGQQLANAQFGLGSNLQGLGSQTQQAGAFDVSQLMGQGRLQQQQAQAVLDAERANQLTAQAAPLAQYQALSPFINMAPKGSFQTSTRFTPRPSAMMAGINTGLGAFGAFGSMARGSGAR